MNDKSFGYAGKILRINLSNEKIEIEEIIYINAGSRFEIYDLDKMTEEISKQLKKLGLIWDAIQEQFELLILNLIIKNAIDMGFLEADRDKLLERISQSK